MSTSERLFHPLDAGLIPLAVGTPLSIVRAKPSAALTKRTGVSAVQTYKPHAVALEQMGIRLIETPENNLPLIAVEITRSKRETLGLIALAVKHLDSAGWCLVDGAKGDGIDSILKTLRATFPNVESYSKAHGRVIWFQPGAVRPEEINVWADAVAPRKLPNGYITQAGVFSEDSIDEGSAFLVEHLPPSLSGEGADLGAGWGYISAEILKKATSIQSLHLFEAEQLALTCSKHNVSDPRATFVWSDVTRDELGEFDFILMNPPFHTERAADEKLGQSFIRAAAGALKRNGTIYMVANRHLPYEKVLDEHFVEWQEVAKNNRFKVFYAQRPKSKPRG